MSSDKSEQSRTLTDFATEGHRNMTIHERITGIIWSELARESVTTGASIPEWIHRATDKIIRVLEDSVPAENRTVVGGYEVTPRLLPSRFGS